MFRRALRALGSKGDGDAVLGARRVLVLRKAEYPPRSQSVRSEDGAPRRRATAADRRRRNLTALAVFIIVTFFGGLIGELRFLLVANLVACILLIAYLGAAIYYTARTTRSRQPSTAYGQSEVSPPSVAGGGL